MFELNFKISKNDYNFNRIVVIALNVVSRNWAEKLLSAMFYQIFISYQMIALQKLWKMFFTSSKKLFSFSRYSNFCISVFPSFFSLSVIALEVDQR